MVSSPRTGSPASALVLGAGLAALLLAAVGQPDLRVVIRNRGPGAVEHLSVSVRGDHREIPAISAGESAEIDLDLARESGLVLVWKTSDGPCAWAGGYVEPGYRPRLDLSGCQVELESASTNP